MSWKKYLNSSSELLDQLNNQAKTFQKYLSFVTLDSGPHSSPKESLYKLSLPELKDRLKSLQKEYDSIIHNHSEFSFDSGSNLLGGYKTVWSVFQVPPYTAPAQVDGLPAVGHRGYVGFRFSMAAYGQFFKPFHVIIDMNDENHEFSLYRHDLPYFIPVQSISSLYLNLEAELFCSTLCQYLDSFAKRLTFVKNLEKYHTKYREALNQPTLSLSSLSESVVEFKSFSVLSSCLTSIRFAFLFESKPVEITIHWQIIHKDISFSSLNCSRSLSKPDLALLYSCFTSFFSQVVTDSTFSTSTVSNFLQSLQSNKSLFGLPSDLSDGDSEDSEQIIDDISTSLYLMDDISDISGIDSISFLREE